LATNGGFFNTKTGDCLGNLVSEGSVISTGQDCKANFGSVNGNFIIGYINKTTLKTHKFDNLIAGKTINYMIGGANGTPIQKGLDGLYEKANNLSIRVCNMRTLEFILLNSTRLGLPLDITALAS